MAGVLIDSDVLIDALRPRSASAEWLESYATNHELITSAINIFEVTRGLLTPAARESGMGFLDRFRVLHLTGDAALRAASIDRTLRAMGTPLDVGDLLVAGIALANSVAIMTRNVRHFSRIDGLEILDPSV